MDCYVFGWGHSCSSMNLSNLLTFYNLYQFVLLYSVTNVNISRHIDTECLKWFLN